MHRVEAVDSGRFLLAIMALVLLIGVVTLCAFVWQATRQPSEAGCRSKQRLNKYSRADHVTSLLAPVIAFCWPLLYLGFYSVPLGGQYLAIGNDFYTLYYKYKLYLLDEMTSHIRMPLWSPSEAGGYPFFSSPLAQSSYPLNGLLAVYYWVAGGYTALDHQRFTILGVSIFGLGLYFWLRSIELPVRAALFATLVMSVSFKVTDIIRFTNAIHTVAWFPWILCGFTGLLRGTTMGERVRYALLLTFGSICMLTGGFPYFVYYFLFLLGPYALLCAVPFLRRRVLQVEPINWKQSLMPLMCAGVVVLGVCGPYLYAVSSLMQETTDRSGASFDFATGTNFGLKDTLGSLVFPPVAQPEGWYFFGIISLLLIVVFVFTGVQNPYTTTTSDEDAEQPVTSGYSPFWTKVVLLGWWASISYITYGKDSQLFIFLWQHMPLFSILREWGRLNIVLVVVIAWLLALAYSSMELQLSGRAWSSALRRRLAPLAIVASVGLVILALQLYLLHHQLFDLYWPTWFIGVSMSQLMHSGVFLAQQIPAARAAGALASGFLVTGLFSVVILTLLFASGLRRRFVTRRSLGLILTGLVLFASVDMGVVGQLMWSDGFKPVQNRQTLNVDAIDSAAFAAPRVVSPYESIALGPYFYVSTFPSWYFQRYVNFLGDQTKLSDARKRVLGVVDGRRVYCTRAIDYGEPQAFLNDVDSATACRVTEESYDGESLALTVVADADRYVSFIDNWDAGWQATVDGRQVPVELLFSTFKAVKVPAGQHTVTFVYRPHPYGV